MSDDLLKRLKDALISQDSRTALEATKQLLNNGEDPVRIADLIAEGLKEVGDLFEAQELFLPEVMRAANAAKVALNLVIPAIQSRGGIARAGKGRLAIGSLGPHDIGKTLVAAMLVSDGFDVLDLGTMLTPDKVQSAANSVQVIGLSVLLTSDVRKAAEIIKKVKANNPSVRFMVGGAAMSEKIAMEIGADAYGVDAKEAVRIAREMLGGEKASRR
ncbi:MAG: cobalamin-dependent protein [Candidatus Methanosuratincola petrocarbonis]|nr:cobalamin B12-binding domain-containing protein [Candidatus Methanosuratincola sp.]